MLTSEQIKRNSEQFITLLSSVKRNNIEALLNWLIASDFFLAPASTKYHLACKGGLCQHSLNVYDSLMRLCCAYDIDIESNRDTLIIVALLHDVCKIYFYKPTVINVKEGNSWVKRDGYTINDELPLGHGEKSLFLIERFIKLNNEEALAIRWHMGAFDNAFKGGEQALNSAQQWPLVPLLHAADLLSSQLLDK